MNQGDKFFNKFRADFIEAENNAIREAFAKKGVTLDFNTTGTELNDLVEKWVIFVWRGETQFADKGSQARLTKTVRAYVMDRVSFDGVGAELAFKALDQVIDSKQAGAWTLYASKDYSDNQWIDAP